MIWFHNFFLFYRAVMILHTIFSANLGFELVIRTTSHLIHTQNIVKRFVLLQNTSFKQGCDLNDSKHIFWKSNFASLQSLLSCFNHLTCKAELLAWYINLFGGKSFLVKSVYHPHACKTGHFTLLIGWELGFKIIIWREKRTKNTDFRN